MNKFLIIAAISFLYGCTSNQPAAKQAVAKQKVYITDNVINLYSYRFKANIDCNIANNDTTAEENREACHEILRDKARELGVDAVLIEKETSCLINPELDCSKSSAVSIKASAHKSD